MSVQWFDFLQVFMAEQANTGPSGEDINTWLSNVMDGMVSAIDNHVVTVLKNQASAADKAVSEKTRRISSGKSSFKR